jgi:SAM-dependent methyltransferase
MNNNLLIFIKKVINTFLTPRFRFCYYDYDKKFVKNKKNKIIFNILSRLWFFPVNIMSRYWYNVSEKNNHKHNYKKYSKLDDRAKILLKEVIKISDKEYKILDLGCNIGRHLNYLKKKNFKNLNGVDIGQQSINKSILLFPNLKNINLKCASFENYLINAKNGEFDIIYSHGATIELVKPTFPLISEISRVTKKYIILLIAENEHKYPRFWRLEFKFNGLSVEHNKLLKNGQTLLVLKKIND